MPSDVVTTLVSKLEHMRATATPEVRLPSFFPAPFLRGEHPRSAVRGARSPREGRTLPKASARLVTSKVINLRRCGMVRRSVIVRRTEALPEPVYSIHQGNGLSLFPAVVLCLELGVDGPKSRDDRRCRCDANRRRH
eukprot:5403682-Alexandrium_andersonii.AAC.1